jgi:polyphosphate kinase
MMLNMELSQLAFAERVLELADDPRTPLLERARFVAIFGTILDEFFMTRVAGFRRQVAEGRRKRTLDGILPEEQLSVITRRTRELLDHVHDRVVPHLMTDLLGIGIEIAGWNVPLRSGSGDWSDPHLYADRIREMASASLQPGGPFPHVRNLRPAFLIRSGKSEAGMSDVMAVLELPGDQPRLLPLPGGHRFMPVEEVMRASFQTPSEAAGGRKAFLFRVVRGGNLLISTGAPDDILEAIAENLAMRPFQPVVRLEVEPLMPEWGRTLLLQQLDSSAWGRGIALGEEDLYPRAAPIDLNRFSEIAALPAADLHFPSRRSRSPLVREASVMDQLDERDALIRFPSHSFSQTVDRFLREAGDDPRVEEIWVTLYRTNHPSRTVRLLRRAHRRGKVVTVLVEVKASFDEKQNLAWAKVLEADGIRVLYGSPSLKVHAKIACVVRREGSSPGDQKDTGRDAGHRVYCYIGTGNLNAVTSRAYTDLGLLTADQRVGRELHTLFRTLAGDESSERYESLLVAPFNLRGEIIRLINREAENARTGGPSGITAKLNGLADRQVIDALYRADQAGVPINLLVRGICSLRPGVPGFSGRTRVVALAGALLEHARILRFENAGSPELFIGSADLRGRNLSRRVEVMTRVTDPGHQETLNGILREGFSDPDAWELGEDGCYHRRCIPEERSAAGFSTLASVSAPG